jgi:predicted DNA-binding transcriptional regulator AlpA
MAVLESFAARVNKMNLNGRKRMRAAKAAGYLEVSRSTLAKWRKSGKGPPYHRCDPRIVHYYQDEIDRWQEECGRQESRRTGRANPAPPSNAA